jgi:hypothetical protein
MPGKMEHPIRTHPYRLSFRARNLNMSAIDPALSAALHGRHARWFPGACIGPDRGKLRSGCSFDTVGIFQPQPLFV